MSNPWPEDLLERMRLDWDERVRDNACYFVATGQQDWNDEEFFRSGENNVGQQILNDMINICQGRDPAAMRVLEIGCGAGRITRALAQVFGRVDGVDVSGEIIEHARQTLSGCPNIGVWQNNGADLAMFGDEEFDFAFSYIVFQHIPRKAIVENYMREVRRVLRPGALFKFQVQGAPREDEDSDTWLGVGFSQDEMAAMAARTGFEMRYSHGAETQYFWLWFFKT